MTGGAEGLPQAALVTRLQPAPSSVHNSDSSFTRPEGTWKTGWDTEWQSVSLPARTVLSARESLLKKRSPAPDLRTVTVALMERNKSSPRGICCGFIVTITASKCCRLGSWQHKGGPDWVYFIGEPLNSISTCRFTILFGTLLQTVSLKILEGFPQETLAVLVESFRISFYQVSVLG